MSLEEFHAEIESGERFEFGKNWKAFLKKLNKERIEQAENSLKIMLGVKNLVGKTFVDVGSGSGLFSLAAKNLGASVVSFDFDKSSVWCTKELKNRFYKTNTDWKIIHGSILDKKFLVSLGKFDYVYSWGVLHHTKNTREAFSKVCSQVKKGGMLHIMVYNKENDWAYDGYRGDTCVAKHEEWEKLTFKEQIEMCKNKVKSDGGDVHGWFDAFNPKFNWSHSADEVKQWFEEEGFTNIKLRMIKQNINMNGILE